MRWSQPKPELLDGHQKVMTGVPRQAIDSSGAKVVGIRMKFYQPRLVCDVATAMCAELPEEQREAAEAFARKVILEYAQVYEKQERRLRPLARTGVTHELGRSVHREDGKTIGSRD